MLSYKKIIVIISLIIILSCSQNQSIEQLIENGEYKIAANLLEDEVQKGNKRSDYIMLMIVYNNKLERYPDALNTLKKYKDQFHNIDDIRELASIILTNNAGEMFVSGNMDSCLTLLIESSKFNKNNKRTYKLLAKCYAKVGVLDSAQIFISKAIDLDNNDKESHLINGNIHYLNNNGEESQRSYLRAIEIDSMYYEAYINLGTLYYNTDNYKYALRIFKKAINIDSMGILAYDYIINIYSDADLLDSSYKYAKLFENKKQEFLLENEDK